MGALETNTTLIYGIHMRESATDGSDFSNGAADYRVLFLGEDGFLHVKDSAGAVTDPYDVTGGAVASYVRKTAGDQAFTSTSFADVTGLTFAVSASTVYKFRFVVFLITSGTGEGYALSVNGPAGTYKFGGILPAAAPNAAGNASLIGTGGAADSAGLAVTAGPGGTNTFALIEGVVAVGGSGGTLALRARAETGGANSVTVQNNSIGELVEIT
jgi:hypothetical protein